MNYLIHATHETISKTVRASFTVENDTMNDDIARQYAATELFDDDDLADIDVNDIEVSWQ